MADSGFVGSSMTSNSEHRFNSNWKYLLLALLVGTLLVWYSTPMRAQTLISGEVTGTVTDPSGAVVPNATVTLKSNETGQSRTATTNSNGYYRFPLQQPGNYTITVSAPNFQAASQTINVAVAQATTTKSSTGLIGSHSDRQWLPEVVETVNSPNSAYLRFCNALSQLRQVRDRMPFRLFLELEGQS